jgi:large subunit ribosomal protein L10
MTTRACDATGLGAMKEQLKGMTALAISKEDPIAAAKVMKEYSDKIETFSILGGYVDGEYVDAKGVEALAAIPSKEGLVAKILASLQSPLYGLAYVLQAKIDKENGDSAPEAAAE